MIPVTTYKELTLGQTKELLLKCFTGEPKFNFMQMVRYNVCCDEKYYMITGIVQKNKVWLYDITYIKAIVTMNGVEFPSILTEKEIMEHCLEHA